MTYINWYKDFGKRSRMNKTTKDLHHLLLQKLETIMKVLFKEPKNLLKKQQKQVPQC